MHPNLVDAAQAFLLVVDLQETYRDKLHEWSRTLERCSILVQGAQLLELPIFCTEQYPKRLGTTAPELRAKLGEVPLYEKRALSALAVEPLREALLTLGRRQAIVCGIETHACINHTVHDLLEAGFTVHVPEDAISSRHASDHVAGYRKMLASGALGGSVESVLFEGLRTADHPAFRAVQALVR